ncbi:hypothetical protein AWV80_10440 [Cupriavidus sp. UYMU48A]|nr:hypothetical protein AWV80_10440 [Cupriavidus sp. UYMU48A]
MKGTYAIGLGWRHEDTIPKAKALKAMAEEKGRWGVVYKTSADAIQAGFCDPIEGVKTPRGIKVLAAVVADAHPQPWLGTFDLGNGLHWLLAVRDGNEVIPDGDVVGTLEAIQLAREKHLPLGDWNQVAGTLSDLADIARASRNQPSLRELTGQSWVLWGGIAAGTAVILAAGGAWYWHQLQVEADRQAQLAAARAREAAMRQRQQVIVLPWTLLPAPSAVLSACERAWNEQSLARSGSAVASWTCSVSAEGTAITVVWKRYGGTASEMPGAMTTPDSSMEQRSYPKPEMGLPALATADRPAEAAAWDLAQAYSVPLKLEAAKAPVALPGSESTTQPAPAWQSKTATFVQPAPPWLTVDAHALDLVPGLRVTEVTFTMDKNEWLTSGSLYSLPVASAAEKA